MTDTQHQNTSTQSLGHLQHALGHLQHVSYALDNGVGELILNRAEVHNAFDEVMISEMIAVLGYFAERQDCKLLLLKANGKNFSAGADLNWMRKQAKMDFDQNLNDAKALAKLMQDLDTFPKPTDRKSVV